MKIFSVIIIAFALISSCSPIQKSPQEIQESSKQDILEVGKLQQQVQQQQQTIYDLQAQQDILQIQAKRDYYYSLARQYEAMAEQQLQLARQYEALAQQILGRGYATREDNLNRTLYWSQADECRRIAAEYQRQASLYRSNALANPTTALPSPSPKPAPTPTSVPPPTPNPTKPDSLPGLIGWWSGDGNTSDMALGNNAILRNGATYSPGIFGQAFSLESKNSFVEVPHSNSLNPGNITVECWFKIMGATPEWSALIKKAGNNGYALEMASPNQINFYVFTENWHRTPPFTVSTDTWYHVAGTYDGSYIKLYVNGALAGQSPASGSIAPSSSSLRIGSDPAYPVDSNRMFNGLIDEVKIYNRALDAHEIKTNYGL